MRVLRTILPLVLLGLGMGLYGPTAVCDEDAGALRVDKHEHEFGDVGQHQEHVAEFAYTNTSDTTVTGIRSVADCGCYGVTLSDVELAPGKTGKLTVRFRTMAFSGTVRKYVTLLYDDGAKRTLRLGLVLAVRAGVVLEPGRMHFGEVLVGSQPSGHIHALYYRDLGKPFQVTSIQLPKGDFHPSRAEPYQDPRDERWRGWRIPFAFARPLEKGIYSKKAVIETDHPDYPRLTVSLTASAVGKVWVQTPRIYVGMVPKGGTRSTETLIRPFDASIRLGKVDARSRSGVLETRLVAVPGRQDTYRLEITVPGDAPVGRIDDVIEVKTEVPDEPLTEVVVRGRVYAPR